MNASRRSLRHLLLWLSCLSLFIACSVLSLSGGVTKVPVQQWLQSRGPVVPHDSFPSDCKTCHEGGGWHNIRADFSFDHEKQTGHPLAGAHREAECLRCHNDRGPVTKFTTKGCTGCHERWHKSQMGSDCTSCHDEQTWQPKQMIAEHNMTRFALVGAHAGVACWACHPGAQVGEFKHASTDCVVCHREQLAQTTDPNHMTSGWTTDCQRCHSPIGWRGAAFVHDTFLLTGAHKNTLCTKCHVNGVYRGTPRDCISCHTSEYNGTTTPNHPGAGFSTDCTICHNTSTWQGATFAHTSYPLTGAHRSTDCTACHKNNVYQGTSRNCVDCHLTAYNATTNPNHQSAGFPTSCESCHNTTQWEGATFNHSFPRTGPHNVSCTTCHTTPGNSVAFSCLGCHEHRQTKMDDKHKNINGYSYSSPACLSCHPNGKH